MRKQLSTKGATYLGMLSWGDKLLGFVGFQPVRSGEKIEDDWSDGSKISGFPVAARGQERSGTSLDFLTYVGIDFDGVFEAGHGEQMRAGADRGHAGRARTVPRPPSSAYWSERARSAPSFSGAPGRDS